MICINITLLNGQLFNSLFQILECYFFGILLTWVDMIESIE